MTSQLTGTLVSVPPAGVGEDSDAFGSAASGVPSFLADCAAAARPSGVSKS